jgi:hypothetical protein
MDLELAGKLIIPLLQTNPYFNLFTLAVAVASTITAITPTPKKESKLRIPYKIIDIIALNVWKAKNK